MSYSEIAKEINGQMQIGPSRNPANHAEIDFSWGSDPQKIADLYHQYRLLGYNQEDGLLQTAETWLKLNLISPTTVVLSRHGEIINTGIIDHQSVDADQPPQPPKMRQNPKKFRNLLEK